ncbi:MAG: hypothetical protein ABI925_07095 [Verrucomicrobiota bacterium]
MKIQTKWSIAAIIVVICAVGYFATTRALDHFLENGTLARLISRKTAVKLAADSGYLPLTWRGMSIRSDGLLTRGKPEHGLTEMRAANVRARCSLQNLWQRKWTITLLQSSHLEAAFGQAAATKLEKILPREPELQPQIDTNSPLNLEIRQTFIPRTDVYWGETPDSIGMLKEVQVRFFPKDHELDAVGRGGTFQQTGWPELKVGELQLHYAKSKLVVRSALFSIGQPKNIHVTGDFDFGEHGSMRLHLSSKQTPAAPFLRGFWRGKLEGVLDSETNLQKQFEADAKMNAAGQLNFTRASVHDVSALKQIATVTRHPQFEKPKIDVLRFQYRLTGDRLEVSEFEVETKGLLRIEGELLLEHDNIDAKFKVGVAPDVVETIPGAREKVFTESHGGYLWTTMKLSGPASHPRDDLKPRIIEAAKEHFAKGILAPIFKPGTGMLEMLNAIYP